MVLDLRKNLFIIIILGFFIISGSNLILADEDENHTDKEEHDELSIAVWIGHAILSILGLLLGIIILYTGGRLKGRFKKPKEGNILKQHKIITVFFTLVMIATFFYGLWITSGHEDAVLLTSIHGMIGLILIILSILSLIISPCVSKKKIGGKIHSVFGYIIVIILLVQLYLGFQNVI